MVVSDGANYNTLFVSTTGGGGGLTNITEALSTSSSNATNNAASLTVTGGTSTTFFALVPKGTGGLMGQVPDATLVGLLEFFPRHLNGLSVGIGRVELDAQVSDLFKGGLTLGQAKPLSAEFAQPGFLRRQRVSGDDDGLYWFPHGKSFRSVQMCSPVHRQNGAGERTYGTNPAVDGLASLQAGDGPHVAAGRPPTVRGS
jgi:hypothetical protein